jgi:magnesium-transporting ATPase (P-type)
MVATRGVGLVWFGFWRREERTFGFQQGAEGTKPRGRGFAPHRRRWGKTIEDIMNTGRNNRRFQWNAGGWFGGLFGSTAYILIIGLFVLFDSPRNGIPIVLCGVIPNLIGFLFWKRKDQINPYLALQASTFGIFIFATLFFAFIVWGIDPKIASKYFAGVEKAWWILLLFPALMINFWNIERNGRNRPQQGSEGTSPR